MSIIDINNSSHENQNSITYGILHFVSKNIILRKSDFYSFFFKEMANTENQRITKENKLNTEKYEALENQVKELLSFYETLQKDF
jgi:hypothetical protein